MHIYISACACIYLIGLPHKGVNMGFPLNGPLEKVPLLKLIETLLELAPIELLEMMLLEALELTLVEPPTPRLALLGIAEPGSTLVEVAEVLTGHCYQGWITRT